MKGGDNITATELPSNPLRDKLGVKTPSELIPWLNVLVYADPGVGKTTFLGTAQDHEDTSPLLILDVEGGTTTLRGKSVDVVSVRSVADIVKTYKDLYDSIETDDKGNKFMYYKTVGIDSGTELAKLDMIEIMAELVERRPDLNPDVPGMREWGINAEHMRKIIRRFRDLPCNTIMTALALEHTDELNIKTHGPAFSGKLKSEIPGFLDIVGLMQVKPDGDTLVRTLQTAKTPRVTAKDRTGTLDPIIMHPSIPLLWNTINS